MARSWLGTRSSAGGTTAGIGPPTPTIFSNLPYSDDMVGSLVLDGDAYTYVGARLASFEPGDNFQIDAPPICP